MKNLLDGVFNTKALFDYTLTQGATNNTPVPLYAPTTRMMEYDAVKPIEQDEMAIDNLYKSN